MEEIKAPKKERRFLKAMGEVALTLFRELLLGVGKKVINKVGNKRQGLAIALVMVAGVSYAAIDSIPYPITGNKQRLGWQTSGNGLVYRGRAADTITKPSNYTNKDIKAYLLVDTVNNVMYSYIASKGGWKYNNSDTVIVNNNFAQPVDSLFFKTSVPTNNVDTAKMRWDSDLGTVVLGMYDKVPNELGFKNFWLVKNQTGSTITKGSIVYANGTVGASGRITVAKFIANGSIESKYLLGITAHDLTNGEDGYVISYGKIRQVNTDTFTAGAILYPSPTTAGVWTDVEPVAPNIDMPIGFCINSHVNNGTIAIKVESGYKLHELHDLAISSPVDKASLYYKSSEGLWRDTTATLLVSDTASMLTNYLRTNVASSTYQPILVSGTNIKTVNSNSLLGSGNISVGTITGSGSNLYFPIFTSSTNITQSLLRWDGTATPNSILYNDYNSNQLIGALTVGGTLGVTGAITGGSGITVLTKSIFGNIGVGGDSMIVNGYLKLNNRYPTTTDVNRIVAFNTDNSVLSELNFSNLFDVENSGVGLATQTLNIKSASTTQIGVVDISSQSFFGNKTFTSNITLENDVDNRQGYLRRGYVTITNATYTVADNVSWIICNRSGGTITITLPNALDNDGRELHIKNITTNSVISNATNVVELADNAATTAILSASKDGGWATLVSNGSNWVIMQAN